MDEIASRLLLSAGSRTIESALVDVYQSGSLGTTYTTSRTVSLGTPFPGRVVVACVYVFRNSNITWGINSVTLGGNAMTLQEVGSGSGSVAATSFPALARCLAGIYTIVDSTNTSATLTINTSEKMVAAGVQILTLSNANPTPYSTFSTSGTNAPETGPFSLSTTVPDVGFVVGFFWNLFPTANNTSQGDFSTLTDSKSAITAPYGSSYVMSSTMGYGKVNGPGTFVSTVTVTPSASTYDGVFKMLAAFQLSS